MQEQDGNAPRSFAIRADDAADESAPRIGRYEIRGVLGEGSMGVVYRAVDTVLGRTVAIKTIREELLSGEHIYEAYRRRFYQEARIFGSLSHPNIVKLYDIGETEARIPFLAMEFVSGTSLARREERLSLDRTMWLLAQVASAVDYAHAQDVLHRDIKPSNVLVGSGDEAKIADFGVAKLLGSEFTRSQTRFGTPGYMSPEQVIGKTLTGRSDIFSLGALAFELLSGEAPFPGKTVHSILHRVVHADPVVPASLESLGLSPERWTEVFARALAKDPEPRYATASALVTDLVEIFPGSWLGHLLSEDAGAKSPARSQQEDQETLTLALGHSASLKRPADATHELTRRSSRRLRSS